MASPAGEVHCTHRQWDEAHRTALKDSEIDPWGHQRLRDHLEGIWNVDRGVRRRTTQKKKKATHRPAMVQRRTNPVRTVEAEVGWPVLSWSRVVVQRPLIAGPPKAVLPPSRPPPSDGRGLHPPHHSMPPPVVRGVERELAG